MRRLRPIRRPTNRSMDRASGVECCGLGTYFSLFCRHDPHKDGAKSPKQTKRQNEGFDHGSHSFNSLTMIGLRVFDGECSPCTARSMRGLHTHRPRNKHLGDIWIKHGGGQEPPTLSFISAPSRCDELLPGQLLVAYSGKAGAGPNAARRGPPPCGTCLLGKHLPRPRRPLPQNLSCGDEREHTCSGRERTNRPPQGVTRERSTLAKIPCSNLQLTFGATGTCILISFSCKAEG